jgi:S-DNA-T family DNA segregation ATPase FtsK/SpoIIIE
MGDAFRLPRAPGHGYLRVGTDQLDRFRAAYVSGVHRRPEIGGMPVTADDSLVLQDFTSVYVAADVEEDQSDEPPTADDAFDDAIGESLLDILVDRLTGRGTDAHQIWLPPLDESPALDEVLGTAVIDSHRGVICSAPELHGRLTTIAGIVDRPLEQRRDPLLLDLSAGGGHVAVVGGPQSGKSTALASIITSLALTHTPREVQFYCLDFGGGVLGGLRNLPHVGGIAGRQDLNAVRRTVAEVMGIIAEREREFAAAGVDGIAAYRELRRNGAYADSPYGDVFLVVDGWLTVRNDFDDLEMVLADVATRGLAYGVHLMIGAARWFDLRTNIRDLCGTKLELRLGDPTDSVMDRRTAALVPSLSPGRGVSASKHQFLMAQPRLSDDAADRAGTSALVERIRSAWPGEPAPAVRLLPTELPFEQLDGESSPELGLAIGIAESDLAPIRLDLNENPCFIVLGDTATGKSGFLRNVARRVQEVYTPQQARLLVIDHRRSLLGGVEGEHLIGYGTNHQSSAGLIADACQALSERIPGPDVTPPQLRERSWWHGPDLYLLVDDYDLVAGTEGHPLMPLLQFIPQAADIGLRVIVARRIGGAGRGFFEPVLGRLRDVGSPGLQLSGSREEGPLLGGLRPQPFPPGRGRYVTRQGTHQLIQLTQAPVDD